MNYELFSIAYHHPAMRPRCFTLEELVRYARWTDDYQRRLKLDPGARFGPPEGEAWLPDPEVVFESRSCRDPKWPDAELKGVTGLVRAGLISAHPIRTS